MSVQPGKEGKTIEGETTNNDAMTKSAGNQEDKSRNETISSAHDESVSISFNSLDSSAFWAAFNRVTMAQADSKATSPFSSRTASIVRSALSRCSVRRLSVTMELSNFCCSKYHFTMVLLSSHSCACERNTTTIYLNNPIKDFHSNFNFLIPHQY